MQCNHARVPPPPVISTEARSETTSGAEKSLTLYACFCNVHLPVFYTITLLSPCQILRLRASLVARHFAQDDRTGGVAGLTRGRIPRAASCRGHVPRKCVTTLPNLLRGQRGGLPPYPCFAQDDNLRGLLKAEFADARFYFLSTRCTAKPPKSSERYATLGLPLASYFIELSSMVKPRALN